MPLVLLEEMHQAVRQDEKFMSRETGPRYFKVAGSVGKIMAERPLCYSACPECKKKVNLDDQGWRCERCQKVMPNCNWAYNFSLRITDFSSSIFA